VTDTEKLILVLCGIHEHWGVDKGTEEKPFQEAIPTDNAWALIWQPAIFSGQHDTPEHVREVVDTLDMLSFIESSYGWLRRDDQTGVTKRDLVNPASEASMETRRRRIDPPHSRRQNASVAFHVSAVSFNRDGTRALVYVGRDCGSLCGIISWSRRMGNGR
jgi:hypothetical protein